MLHASIRTLFGRDRDGHRKRHRFHLRRRNHDKNDVNEELKKYFLDKPNLKNIIYHDEMFAFVAVQGWRRTMEDQHKHLVPFDHHLWKSWSCFSIFDGHNGRKRK